MAQLFIWPQLSCTFSFLVHLIAVHSLSWFIWLPWQPWLLFPRFYVLLGCKWDTWRLLWTICIHLFLTSLITLKLKCSVSIFSQRAQSYCSFFVIDCLGKQPAMCHHFFQHQTSAIWLYNIVILYIILYNISSP